MNIKSEYAGEPQAENPYEEPEQLFIKGRRVKYASWARFAWEVGPLAHVEFVGEEVAEELSQEDFDALTEDEKDRLSAIVQWTGLQIKADNETNPDGKFEILGEIPLSD